MSVEHKKHITQEHIEALQQIAVQLIASADDHELLTLIVTKAMGLLKCDAGSLYLLQDEQNLVFSVAVNHSVAFEFEKSLIPLNGNGIAAQAFRTGETLKVKDVYHLPKDSVLTFDTGFDRKVSYRTRSVIAVPLNSSKGEKLGILQLINKKNSEVEKWESTDPKKLESMPVFGSEDELLLKTFAALASASIEKAKLYENIENLFEGFIRASVRVIEERDPGTKGHSERVASLTVELARRVSENLEPALRDISFTHKQLQELHYAALLHDFGKVSVSERVLLKEEKLFLDEILRIRSRLDHFSHSTETQMLWEALKAIARDHRAPTDFEILMLEKKIREKKSEIEGFWDIIREANRPTVLDEAISKGLESLKDKHFQILGGELRKLIEPQEFAALSIPRGSLTPKERRDIENHVTSTYLFLKEIPWTQDYAQVPDIAYCHHEKLDATGYPRQLQAKDIPVQSRMMAICDIYDALVASDRPYKKSLPIEKALSILDAECKSGKLDPRFLKVFKEAKVYVNSEFLSLNPFKKAA